MDFKKCFREKLFQLLRKSYELQGTYISLLRKNGSLSLKDNDNLLILNSKISTIEHIIFMLDNLK